MMTVRTAMLGLSLTIAFSHVSVAQDAPLNIYGYFDSELTASNEDGNGGRWGFDQHHFSLSLIRDHNAHFRVFAQLDWEHGVEVTQSKVLGKTYLAQAFLEYKHDDLFQFRVGQFAAPFGIYNERHDATPTFPSTTLPDAVYGMRTLGSGEKEPLFPKFSAGVQLRGRVLAGAWEGTYQLYISNGRGEKPSSDEDNTNKGVGVRLTVEPPARQLRFGVSLYADRNGRNHNARQLAVGADAEWDRGPAHFEAEAIYSRIERADSVGTLLDRFDDGVGWYVLAAVTFLDRFMPFVRHGVVDQTPYGQGDRQRVIVMGVNTSLTHQVVLKNEVHFHRHRLATDGEYETFIASVAASF